MRHDNRPGLWPSGIKDITPIKIEAEEPVFRELRSIIQISGVPTASGGDFA